MVCVNDATRYSTERQTNIGMLQVVLVSAPNIYSQTGTFFSVPNPQVVQNCFCLLYVLNLRSMQWNIKHY